MQLILTPELETLVQRQIASGKFQSAHDVLLAGVQLLEEQQKADHLIYGEINNTLQFVPLNDAEMIEQSLEVLNQCLPS